MLNVHRLFHTHFIPLVTLNPKVNNFMSWFEGEAQLPAGNQDVRKWEQNLGPALSEPFIFVSLRCSTGLH